MYQPLVYPAKSEFLGQYHDIDQSLRHAFKDKLADAFICLCPVSKDCGCNDYRFRRIFTTAVAIAGRSRKIPNMLTKQACPSCTWYKVI